MIKSSLHILVYIINNIIVMMKKIVYTEYLGYQYYSLLDVIYMHNIVCSKKDKSTSMQVYKLLRTQGHNVVAVFTVPDIGGRPDPLAEVAEGDGVPVLKFKQWRKKGQVIPEVSHAASNC